MDAFTLDALVIAVVLLLTIASMAGWLGDREPPAPKAADRPAQKLSTPSGTWLRAVEAFYISSHINRCPERI